MALLNAFHAMQPSKTIAYEITHLTVTVCTMSFTRFVGQTDPKASNAPPKPLIIMWLRHK